MASNPVNDPTLRVIMKYYRMLSYLTSEMVSLAAQAFDHSASVGRFCWRMLIETDLREFLRSLVEDGGRSRLCPVLWPWHSIKDRKPSHSLIGSIIFLQVGITWDV